MFMDGKNINLKSFWWGVQILMDRKVRNVTKIGQVVKNSTENARNGKIWVVGNKLDGKSKKWENEYIGHYLQKKGSFGLSRRRRTYDIIFRCYVKRCTTINSNIYSYFTSL